jgi:DNA processing protein
MEEKKFLICAKLAGLGPVRLKKLIGMRGSLEKVFTLSAEELKAAGIPLKIAEKVCGWNKLPWREEIASCKKKGIRIITMDDREYPFLLKQIFDPPYMLYVKGHLPLSDNNIAIVGTRNPSFYGIKMAEKFAMELAYCGFTVVSGLARGIDAAAHRGALKIRGKTVGVLGSGFGHFYPHDNLRLSEEMAEKGAVITEFSFSSKPEPSHFPLRNRIVSGMSRGVLVIEAGQKSGALITANLAAEQGREVFAVPGQIDNLFSKGVNRLLKEGAALAEDTRDILDSLNMEAEKIQTFPTMHKKELSAGEKKIMEVIGSGKKHIEELLVLTGMSHAELSGCLIGLIIKKILVEMPGKMYAGGQNQKDLI